MAEASPQVDSVMNSVAEPLATVYAEALLAQVPTDAEAIEVAEELDGVVELLDTIEGFDELLTAALLSHADRCDIIERVFHGRISEPLEAALTVMGQAGRLGLLRTLRRVFRSALYRRQGKLEVTVVTAVLLDESQREHVVSALAETLSAEPVPTFQLDPGLLGGMVVRIGDNVYDASVRSDLTKLQRRLTREIRLEAPDRGGGGTA
jgi:F-type H+-transporting ATPase subunit delta